MLNLQPKFINGHLYAVYMGTIPTLCIASNWGGCSVQRSKRLYCSWVHS